ncbi:hypothetical protein [Nocardia sp. NPDC057455]|uniref:hypothetical protein n=1 Tax=Nocardia sp. NPDC057455 TaxID=3346138 RepID=UPI00366DC7D8
MTQIFEQVSSTGTYVQIVAVREPYNGNLYRAAFGVTTLDGMFDMAAAEDALPILDAAIAVMDANKATWKYTYTDPADPSPVGVKYNRMRNVIAGMRNFCATQGGTVNGAFTDPVNP